VTLTTLVLGGRAGAREAAIVAALTPGLATVVILEGLSDGNSALAELAPDPAGPSVLRIAPGCLCCSGKLVLRVNLNRILRRPPARLFISLADSRHVQELRLWLSEPPYLDLLSLGDDLNVAAAQD